MPFGISSPRVDSDLSSGLIGRILPLSNIVLDLELRDKESIMSEASAIFQRNQKISSRDVQRCLIEREKMGSTALGKGVAIPHGRLDGIEQPIGAFLRLREAIPFDSPDLLPVNLLFVILVPKNAARTHLDILAALGRIFADSSHRESLLSLPTPGEVYRLLLTPC